MEEFFDDARVHVEPSGKLKSFVSALAGMAVPCDYDDQEALEDHFPTPNATRISARHVDDAIQRLSPTYPWYLLEFMRANLPEAVAAGVVTAGEDVSAFSRRSLGTRWSRRVYDSIIRCVANGVPELIDAVGHNGLYLGSDHKFSSRLNRHLSFRRGKPSRGRDGGVSSSHLSNPRRDAERKIRRRRRRSERCGGFRRARRRGVRVKLFDGGV